jgi:hypothetical protein
MDDTDMPSVRRELVDAFGATAAENLCATEPVKRCMKLRRMQQSLNNMGVPLSDASADFLQSFIALAQSVCDDFSTHESRSLMRVCYSILIDSAVYPRLVDNMAQYCHMTDQNILCGAAKFRIHLVQHTQ